MWASGNPIPSITMTPPKMFHTIPYAEAKRRGAIQEEILDELTSRTASLDEVDLALADRLIAERPTPSPNAATCPDCAPRTRV